MSKVDIVDFLIKGHELNGICLNDPVDKVISQLGQPIEIVGDNKAGFFHYDNGLRYGYFDTEIAELAILFHETEKYSYPAKNQFDEEITISGSTQLHEFIYLLKTKGFEWHCLKDKNMFDLTMEINSKVYVFFDLYTGYLNKIFVGRR